MNPGYYNTGRTNLTSGLKVLEVEDLDQIDNLVKKITTG